MGGRGHRLRITNQLMSLHFDYRRFQDNECVIQAMGRNLLLEYSHRTYLLDRPTSNVLAK